MKFPGLRAARVLYSAILLLPLSSLSSVPAPAPDLPAVTPGESEIAAKGETRLRKLHLVRPDLINYPIGSDMLC